MGRARANGIELEYETFGDASSPPMLLISGLGSQLVSWDADFCEQLAARGYHVIRFDNRDVGFSTKFDDVCPDPEPLMAKMNSGEPVEPPYRLEDMADDAAGLLEALGLESAHVVGSSVGGSIAQLVAIRHPARVRSLTSMVSLAGRFVDQPPGDPEINRLHANPPPPEREARIEHSMALFRIMYGPHFPFDEQRVRSMVTKTLDRSDYARGQRRHLLAVSAAGSRVDALSKLRVRALVIHGDADPVIHVSGGIETAQAIPGARLLIIEGMGHSLHPHAWPQIIDAIDALARAA